MTNFSWKSLWAGCAFVGASLVLSGSGNAAFLKFYSGADTYTGPYSAGAYQATKFLATDCPDANPGCDPGGDLFDNPMDFLGGTVRVDASGPLPGTYEVWNDLSPANSYAGLGVKEPAAGQTSDHINDGDALTITFGSSVILDAVITLFTGTHQPFGPGGTLYDTPGEISTNNAAEGFSFLLNGVSTRFDAANQVNPDGTPSGLGLGLVGTTFTFKQLADNPSYYVSGLIFTVPGGSINPVPVPAALPLFGGGLALLSFLGWRRRRASAV